LAIVYDPECTKLREDNYSQVYRDMFLALIEKFEGALHITSETDFNEVEADVIIIYDIHSTYHVELKNIEKHKAVKYTYYNDPWQWDEKGYYNDTPDKYKYDKLGAERRAQRSISRGIDYYICASPYGYHNYLSKYIPEDRFIFFPHAPNRERYYCDTPITERRKQILLNGHLWGGREGFRPYKFRTWAYFQKIFTNTTHPAIDKDLPKGLNYAGFIRKFAGSCSFCTVLVPKYQEIPLSGCVNFIQRNYDSDYYGFKDMENCVYMTKGNAHKRVLDFLEHIEDYQKIADAGRLMAENYTSDKFGEYIYNHALATIQNLSDISSR